MKDLFVPYELAVKLKEKGFKYDCLKFWYNDEGGMELIGYRTATPAPLWQQVTDWLREENGIFVRVNKDTSSYWCDINMHLNENEKYLEIGESEGYYISLQSGIEKALELI